MKDDVDEASQTLLDAIRAFVLAVVDNRKNPERDPEGFSFHLDKAPKFTLRWADGDESFEPVKDGSSRWFGENYSIRIGFAKRTAVGKKRVRVAVWVKGHLAAEFAGADDVISDEEKAVFGGKVASLVRGEGRKDLARGDEIPPEYRRIQDKIAPYRSVVHGKGERSGMAVVCEQNDYATMIKHALIRYNRDRWMQERLAFYAKEAKKVTGKDSQAK